MAGWGLVGALADGRMSCPLGVSLRSQRARPKPPAGWWSGVVVGFYGDNVEWHPSLSLVFQLTHRCDWNFLPSTLIAICSTCDISTRRQQPHTA